MYLVISGSFLTNTCSPNWPAMTVSVTYQDRGQLRSAASLLNLPPRKPTETLTSRRNLSNKRVIISLTASSSAVVHMLVLNVSIKDIQTTIYASLFFLFFINVSIFYCRPAAPLCWMSSLLQWSLFPASETDAHIQLQHPSPFTSATAAERTLPFSPTPPQLYIFTDTDQVKPA